VASLQKQSSSRRHQYNCSHSHSAIEQPVVRRNLLSWAVRSWSATEHSDKKDSTFSLKASAAPICAGYEAWG